MPQLFYAALLAALLLAPSPQTKEPAPVDAARVARAVAALEKAFDKGKTDERVSAVVAHQEVVDVAVLAWFVKGLKDSDAKVRNACEDALRFARHPDALSALQDALKRERKLGKDVERMTRLTKCVGQHQSESSIPLFADNAFQPEDAKLIEARILALGNTRSRRACEELIGLMRTAGRQRVQPYMDSFRLALIVLTGVDQGVSQDAWMAWWNDNKSKFELPQTMPALPKDMFKRWNNYWGLDAATGRTTKRGDRGNDPESGR